MRSVVLRLRTDLRARWASTIALVLLLGLMGGVVLAAAAGARRTSSAFDRMLAASHADDVIVAGESDGRESGFFDAVSASDGVRGTAIVLGLGVQPTLRAAQGAIAPIAGIDERFMYEIDRPRVVDGRLPDPDREDEIFVNEVLTEATGLGAGDSIEVRVFERSTTDSGFSGAELGKRTMRITGVGVFPNEIVPATSFDSQPAMYLTPTFAKSYAGGIAFDVMYAQLDPGVDLDALHEEVLRLAKKHGVGGVFFTPRAQPYELARRAIRPTAIALGMFAALLGMTVVLVSGQLIGRQLSLDASDFGSLRAIGMTSGQLFLLSVLRAGIIGAAGSLIAAGIAFALSPLAPVGAARVAEPSPGAMFDPVGLGLGAVVLLAAVLCAALVPALRSAVSASRPDSSQVRVARLASVAARSMLPITAPAGIRLALEPGRGRTSLPVRSTIAGVAFALAAVSLTITFGQNLHALIFHRERFGQNWDITIDGSFNPIENTSEVMRADPMIDAYAGALAEDITVDGVRVPAVAIDDPEKAGIGPTIVEGRAPASVSEIALGGKTLERLGRSVGSTVTVRTFSRTREMTVVGRAVFPAIGLGSFAPTGLGDGAFTVYDAIADDPDRQAYAFVFVRLKDDGRADEVRARLEKAKESAFGETCAQECSIREELTPGDIASYRRVQGTPNGLAAILVLLAAATLVHMLVTSIARRGKDLAILKTLGFERKQVAATVAWQASTLTLVAVIAGVPAGVFAGLWAWAAFADQLGVPRAAYVSVPATIAIAVLTLVLANLVAAVPARIAARISPSRVLRSE